MSSSLMALKATSESITAEQKRIAERKRNILILINHHLIENGYINAAERLQSEAGNLLSKFTIADNIDLNLVLSEYENYYEMRFDKKPKLVRKLADGEEIPVKAVGKQRDVSRKGSGSTNSSYANGTTNNSNNTSAAKTKGDCTDGNKLPNIASTDGEMFSVKGSSITTATLSETSKPATDKIHERMLKPPPQFGGDSELKQLANVISREIYQESPNVSFNDIVCLDEAKRLLIEAVQLPLRFPSLFTGILRPWKGILLHGPPGTGKTLLAKAVATECNTTFFNISASTLVSKWRGDSEKLVRVLFEVARYHAPSTIFLDEIDSILTSRGGEGGEHEASRRMKTELLIQMDGVNGVAQSNDQVFVMAASNLPWDLDIAVLRRLEKRVLVPLPEEKARETLFKKLLCDRVTENSVNYTAIAEATNGYSGADIELVSREAAMMPVRRLMKRIDELDNSPNAYPEPPSKQAPSSSKVRAKVEAIHNQSSTSVIQRKMELQLNDIENFMKTDPVTMEDISAALSTTKPSSDGNIERYIAWQKEYGSV